LDGIEAGWRVKGHWSVTVDLTERGHVFVDLTFLVPGMELLTKFYEKENEKLSSTKGLIFLNELRNSKVPATQNAVCRSGLWSLSAAECCILSRLF